jgi:Carboxypeptidase regulatory-like domain
MKLAVVLGLSWVTIVAAQARSPGAQTQIRDNAAAPVGSGVIAGTVVTDDAASAPIRRVAVTLASGGLQLPRVSQTNDEGRFMFTGLAPGNYTLVAARPGYVSTFYGAKKPGRGPGVPIAVLEGQRVPAVAIRMLHGGVITGTVRMQSGQPAAGVSVQILEVQIVNGQRHPTPVPGNWATDDRAVYRAFGLAPGDYLVRVSIGSSLAATELRQVTLAEIKWAEPPDRAGAPGLPPASPGPAPPPGRSVTYAPVFYPGAPDAAGAAVVTVGPNEERAGIDLTALLVPTAKVAGVVIGEDGQPAAATQVTLVTPEADSSDIVALLLGRAQSRTAPDGSFTLNAVPPGHYTVLARGAPGPGGGGAAPAGGLANLGMNLALPGGSGAAFWASEDIVVNGQDVSNLALRLQPGMTVSGRIAFEGSTLQLPADLTRARVTLLPMPSGASPIEQMTAMLAGSSAEFAADGTFAVAGVTPNRYRVNVTMPGMLPSPTIPGKGWVLKSIVAGDRDVADVPLDVKPGEDVKGLVVTMTDQVTELTGSVVDQAGRTTANFPIVVFSTDRATWTIGSRRIQQGRPTSAGTFTITGLPAGEYYVCAVTDLAPDDLYDPAFLEQLAAASFTITLAEGEKRTETLKLAGGGGM